MNDLIIAGVSSTLLIMGLVEAAKRAGLPDRWAPLLALALGVGIALLLYFRPGHEAVEDDLLAGIVSALAAMGIYSGGRTVVNK